MVVLALEPVFRGTFLNFTIKRGVRVQSVERACKYRSVNILGHCDTRFCMPHTHDAVPSLHRLDLYATVSNVRAYIGVKQGFMCGLQTARGGGVCIPSMLADLRDDIAVLENQYTQLVQPMEGQLVETRVVCEPVVYPSPHRCSTSGLMSTSDFDRYFVVSDIHSRICTKEGMMLGLQACVSRDASVVDGVTMEIADLERMYVDLTRELCDSHRIQLAHSRNLC